jgi:hypothetical protein
MITLIYYACVLLQNQVQANCMLNVQGLEIPIPVLININDLVALATAAGKDSWDSSDVAKQCATIIGVPSVTVGG